MLRKLLRKWLGVEELEGNFELKVRPGTSLPVNKEVQGAMENAVEEMASTIKKGYNA